MAAEPSFSEILRRIEAGDQDGAASSIVFLDTRSGFLGPTRLPSKSVE
jgi:hypothetical protein